MLTFSNHGKKTIPVAIIEGGPDNREMIFLNPDLTVMNRGLIEDYNDFKYENGEEVDCPTSDFEYRLMQKTQGKKVCKNKMNKLVKEVRTEQQDIIGKDFVLNPMDNSVLSPIVNAKMNDKFFIIGKGGQGKSTLANKIAGYYREVYPENNIYLLSRINEDKSIDCERIGIERIPIDKDLLNMNLNAVNDFKNSLVIFDDIEDIINMYSGTKEGQKAGEALYKVITHLQMDCIRLGRSHMKGEGNTYSIHIRHSLYEGRSTSVLHNGCSCVIIFPSGIGAAHYDRFCREQGLDKQMKEKLRNVRWFGYVNGSPSYVFGEKFIYLL